MPDGKHCPNCRKDIGRWALVFGLTPGRVCCPHCLSRLKYGNIRRVRHNTIIVVGMLALLAVGGAVSGMPAVVSGLRGKSSMVPDDEFVIHAVVLLAIFVGSAVPFGCASDLYLRRRKTLEYVSSAPSRVGLLLKFYHLLLRVPLALKVAVVALMALGICSALAAGLPVCRQRALIYDIERLGGHVYARIALPDWRPWNAGARPSGLMSVRLDGPEITDSELARAARDMAAFTGDLSLVISETPVTDRGLRSLAKLRGLSTLTIEGRGDPALTNAGLIPIRELTNLRRLDLKNVSIDDEGLAWLADLPKIRSLSLVGTRVTGRGLAQLDQGQRLESLVLEGDRVSDAGLGGLERLTSLTGLYLSNSPVTDAGLLHLRALPNLTWLQLRNTKVTGAGLVNLKDLQKLQLDLHGAPVTDTGLEGVSELLGVTQLDLGATLVTDAGLARLQPLANLFWLILDDTRVTGPGLEPLRESSKLRGLSLARAPVEDSTLERVCSLTELTYLNLSGTEVTDAGLVHLKELSNLSNLNLANTKITDEGLKHLEPLSKLTWVDLSHTDVSNAGLRQLARLPKLDRLDVTATRVTEDATAEWEKRVRDRVLWGAGRPAPQ